MISLAGRDILHSWSQFVLTGLGLGLLIGVTFTMAGVYRGMVDDAKVLLNNSGADLWVVQKDTLGPYAEPSSVHDDVYRGLLGMPGVAQAANVTYLTMQVRRGEPDVRAMVVGLRARRAGRTALPDCRPARDAQPLRGGGRRERRIRARRPHSHSPARLHRGGPDAADGVVGRRPDGLHPAQGRAGGAVPQGQRRDRERARAHRGEPGAQPSRRARTARRDRGLADQQPHRECRAGARGDGPLAGSGGRTRPPVEARAGLHARRRWRTS